MKTTRNAGCLVLAVFLVSCATMSQSPRTAEEARERGVTHTVGHPHDVVWAATQDFMAARNWDLRESNRTDGYIRSRSFKLPADRDYAHCRSGRRSSVLAYDAEFEIWIRRLTASGSTVTITPRIFADGGPGDECSSTGALEDELYRGIDSVIASRRP